MKMWEEKLKPATLKQPQSQINVRAYHTRSIKSTIFTQSGNIYNSAIMSLKDVSASLNFNLKILLAEHRPCQWPVSMATVSWSAWRFYVTTMSPGASRSSSSQRVCTCWKYTVQSQGLIFKGASWLSATNVNKYILLKLLGQYFIVDAESETEKYGNRNTNRQKESSVDQTDVWCVADTAV